MLAVGIAALEQVLAYERSQEVVVEETIMADAPMGQVVSG